MPHRQRKLWSLRADARRRRTLYFQARVSSLQAAGSDPFRASRTWRFALKNKSSLFALLYNFSSSTCNSEMQICSPHSATVHRPVTTCNRARVRTRDLLVPCRHRPVDQNGLDIPSSLMQILSSRPYRCLFAFFILEYRVADENRRLVYCQGFSQPPDANALDRY